MFVTEQNHTWATQVTVCFFVLITFLLLPKSGVNFSPTEICLFVQSEHLCSLLLSLAFSF